MILTKQLHITSPVLTVDEQQRAVLLSPYFILQEKVLQPNNKLQVFPNST